MRRAPGWIVVSAIVAVLATGCGGDDSSSADDQSGTASQTGDGTDSSSDDTPSDDSSDDTPSDDSSDDTPSDESSDDTPSDDSSEPAETDEAAAEGGGGSGGTLVLGGETIAFDSARCFLQEQDAAAGGGKILFVAQAFGTTAGGDQISIDVSRYDEDSQFTGDDILVDIGDPFSDDAVSLSASAELGTVNVDGSTVSAGDLTFVDFDDFSEQSGSFEINC